MKDTSYFICKHDPCVLIAYHYYPLHPISTTLDYPPRPPVHNNPHLRSIVLHTSYTSGPGSPYTSVRLEYSDPKETTSLDTAL